MARSWSAPRRWPAASRASCRTRSTGQSPCWPMPIRWSSPACSASSRRARASCRSIRAIPTTGSPGWCRTPAARWWSPRSGTWNGRRGSASLMSSAWTTLSPPNRRPRSAPRAIRARSRTSSTPRARPAAPKGCRSRTKISCRCSGGVSTISVSAPPPGCSRASTSASTSGSSSTSPRCSPAARWCFREQRRATPSPLPTRSCARGSTRCTRRPSSRASWPPWGSPWTASRSSISVGRR